jgi:hypothetical protein
MSFPSVQPHLETSGVSDPRNATPDQLHTALIAAFRDDLPLGFAALVEQAEEVRRTRGRMLVNTPPLSDAGRQLARLCGADIARAHMSQHLGVAIGFYNCCGVVMAPTEDELGMSDVEQIQLQNGQLAHADC